MGKCAQCGNNYDQSIEVTMGDRTLVFDSFECHRRARAGLPALRRPHRRPWRAAWRHHLLLRPLRQA
jgi:hypothetical protein